MTATTDLAAVKERLAAIHGRLDDDLDGDGDRQSAAERALYAMGDLLNDISDTLRAAR